MGNHEYLSVFNLNAGKYGPEITPYLDTFYAVIVKHSRFISEAVAQRCSVKKVFLKISQNSRERKFYNQTFK